MLAHTQLFKVGERNSAGHSNQRHVDYLVCAFNGEVHIISFVLPPRYRVVGPTGREQKSKDENANAVDSNHG